jgi:hypothetical protein
MLKIGLPYDPMIPLLCIYTKEHKSGSIETLACSTAYNGQAMEITQMPYDWWMDQENVVYIHNGVLLSHK